MGIKNKTEYIGLYITIEAKDKSESLTLRREGYSQYRILRKFFNTLPKDYQDWIVKDISEYIPAVTNKARQWETRWRNTRAERLADVLDKKKELKKRNPIYWRDGLKEYMKAKHYTNKRDGQYFDKDYNIIDDNVMEEIKAYRVRENPIG
jgi:hypothetical protein